MALWKALVLLIFCGVVACGKKEPANAIDEAKAIGVNVSAVISQMQDLIGQEKYVEARELGLKHSALDSRVVDILDEIKTKARKEELELLLKLTPEEYPDARYEIYKELSDISPDRTDLERELKKYKKLADAKSAALERQTRAEENRKKQEARSQAKTNRERWLTDACYSTCAADYNPSSMQVAFQICFRSCLREALR